MYLFPSGYSFYMGLFSTEALTRWFYFATAFLWLWLYLCCFYAGVFVSNFYVCLHDTFSARSQRDYKIHLHLSVWFTKWRLCVFAQTKRCDSWKLNSRFFNFVLESFFMRLIEEIVKWPCYAYFLTYIWLIKWWYDFKLNKMQCVILEKACLS